MCYVFNCLYVMHNITDTADQIFFYKIAVFVTKAAYISFYFPCCVWDLVY